MASLVFLGFSVLGIILGELLGNYLKCFIIEMLIYIIALVVAKQKRNVIVLSVALVFAMYSTFSCVRISNKESFLEYKDKNVKVVANVLSCDTKNNDLYHYTIQTKTIEFKKQTRNISAKLLLITDQDIFKTPNIYGREIKVPGEIHLLTKNRNIHGFNYKRYLNSRGIEGTIFQRASRIKIGEKTKHSVVLETGMALKYKVLNIIDNLQDGKEAGLLKSILVGYTGDLECDTINNLREIGFAHMLCVSGVNIAHLIMLVKYTLKAMGLPYKFINPLLILSLGLYVLTVGFTPSLVRAAIMLSLTLMGEILFYKSNAVSNLILSALIIVMINPLYIYDIGFQFSFSATIGIILFADNVKRWLKLIKLPDVIIEVITVTIAAQIWLIPLEIYYFNRFSVFAVFTNALVSFVHSTISILGLIMLAIGSISINLAKPIALVEKILLKFIIAFSDKLVKFPFISIKSIYIGIAFIIAYYVILFVMLSYKKHDRLRLFLQRNRKVIVIIVLVVTCVNGFKPNDLRVDFIDVGQGDCALIRTVHGKNILIDGGENVNVCDIIKNNVTKIDVMIATHGHMDHIGGLFNVVDNMKVDKLVIPDTKYVGETDKLLSKVDKTKTCVYKVRSHDHIYIDKYTTVEFLNPSQNSVLEGENANSLVFKLKYKDVSFLFTGDLTGAGENEMLKHYKNLRSDVLKVAHHGSEYSTTSKFLTAVSPKVAVISVGENNRFNHPSDNVLAKLNKSRVKVLRTDKSGQIRIITNGKKIEIRKNLP